MKKVAEKDIKQYLSYIISATSEANIRVIISSDFETTVDSYRNEFYKKYRKYEANHLHTVAYAKTMYFMQGEQLWFAIILDGNIFGSWAKADWMNRLSTLLHEVIHVVDAIAQSKALGIESLFKVEKNLNEIFLSIAIDNWTEYHANRFLLDIIDKAIKEIDSTARVENNLVDGFASTLKEILKAQPSFTNNLIDSLRSRKLSQDDAFLIMVNKIKELLNVAEFFYGKVDSFNDQTKLSSIEGLPEFSKHLGDSWQRIISMNREMYQKNGFDINKLKLVAIELPTIFRQCGIQIFEENNNIHFTLLRF